MADDAPKSDESLNIKVKGSDGQEVYFKVKRTTPFEKVIKAYCKRQGTHPSQVRFLFDGDRVDGNHTPEMLNMEDEDEIDAMVMQTGGGFC